MRHSPIKAVLFDLDDTFWPIAPVIAKAETVLHGWLLQHVPAVARQFSVEQLRSHRLDLLARQPHYQINLSALRHAALTEVFEALQQDTAYVDAAMEVFLKERHAVTLYDDVAPTLARLQDQVMLGVITNGVTDLDIIGIGHFFQVTLAAHSFGTCKPDASIFQAACTALGIAPAEAVYVGDDLEIDIVGAQNAGLHAVWLNRERQAIPTGKNPDAICHNLHELHQWLEQQTIKCVWNDETVQ